MTKTEECSEKDISVHYIPRFAGLAEFSKAEIQAKPIYVLHMKSQDINRDPNILCSGEFNYTDKHSRLNPPPFAPIYNDELCWRKIEAK